MRFVLSFIFLGLTLILSACTSGPSEDEFSPKIGEIDTSITHYHPSAYSHKPADEQRTIGFIARVSITDPDGLGDITNIYIYDKNNDSYFILKDKSKLNADADCFQVQEIIECSFYSKAHPDDMNLTGYELVAVDFHGYSSRKSFQFKLPAGAAVDTEEFVYSDEFQGGTPNGIEGLEVMTIDNNDMVFTLDDQKLHIEFVSNDDRVQEYGVSLYNAESEAIGEVAFDSAAIKAARVVPGAPTSVDIPLNQIEYEDDDFDIKLALQTAILHDTIEDTDTDYDEINEKFNKKIANYVASVTKDTRLIKAKQEKEKAKEKQEKQKQDKDHRK